MWLRALTNEEARDKYCPDSFSQSNNALRTLFGNVGDAVLAYEEIKNQHLLRKCKAEDCMAWIREGDRHGVCGRLNCLHDQYVEIYIDDRKSKKQEAE